MSAVGDTYYDPEYPFRPHATCGICDEPTEVVYDCSVCGETLCPSCVRLDCIRNADTCEDCQLAATWEPDPIWAGEAAIATVLLFHGGVRWWWRSGAERRRASR